MSWKNTRDRLWRLRFRIGFWGYAAEAIAYARAAFAARTPATRFLIFGQGRTGSTLLTHLLNSHSQIHCDDEILNMPVRAPQRYAYVKASLARKPAYGYKVKINQLTRIQRIADVNAFLRDEQAAGWRIIYLQRRNLLRHALSGLVRLGTGRSHHYRSRGDAAGRVRQMHVDPDALLHQMRWRHKLLTEEDRALAGIDFLRVVYEDDLQSPDVQPLTIKRITNWLGLPYEKTSTDLVRITATRLQDLIGNYDEVAAALAGTEFQQHLDDASRETVAT